MRTYSEREVADIIERAAERQAAAPRPDDRVGLTLDEIERIGAEAGLDPAALRAAAAEVDAAGHTLARQASQPRTQVVVERWIDGPLTPEGWEDAVVELQGTIGPDMSAMMGMAAPQQQQVGRAYEWTHTSGLGVRTTVLASPRGGRTRLRITQLVGLSSPAVEGAVYGASIGVLVGLVALFSAIAAGASGALVGLVAFAAFALATAASVPVVTHLDRRWRAGKLQKLGDLADRLAPILVPVEARDKAEAPSVPTPDAQTDGPAPLREAFDAVAGEDDVREDASREDARRLRGGA
ncbi:MAG TPA: hypothetical protein VF576_11500 [Rubricoccaceae bacterium]